ncbi:unnamed protein product [Hymenolepis diminuta]|nr:unnamed protein product [Hymenolepis diminuta]
MKKYNNALTHLRKANKLLGHTDETILKNITICEKNRKSKMAGPTENWCRYHPEPPGSLLTLPKKQTKAETQTTDLPSFKNRALKFKNTKSERGWILEAERDISVGEVVLTEKPYATVLNNPRVKNCYYCHKRCLNLQPCIECPYVGFCNAECEKYAKEQGTSNGEGPGRHTYECHGILPYLLIDQISSHPERGSSYTGCAATCHLAYRIIANTPQKKLIDYITRSGCYKKKGRGHQAFETSTLVRAVLPPMKFVSSDYSSVAWLNPCTESRSRIELWQKTMAAVFLTFCLSVSGYSMSWYEDDFYSVPDADHRPEIIPASWVAACILYHLQALTINCHTNTLISSATSKIAGEVIESIATSVYPTYSLINHSCSPNAVLVNTAQGGIFVFALHTISENSEVTVSYLCSCYSSPAAARRSVLKYRYLFDCNCEACTGLWYEVSLSKLATLKCPECQNLFSISEGICTSCKSNEAFKQYEELTKQINFLLKTGSSPTNWPEEVAKGTQAWNKIQNLVQPRGMIFTSIRTGYLSLIFHRCGNTAIEPFDKGTNLP